MVAFVGCRYNAKDEGTENGEHTACWRIPGCGFLVGSDDVSFLVVAIECPLVAGDDETPCLGLHEDWKPWKEHRLAWKCGSTRAVHSSFGTWSVFLSYSKKAGSSALWPGPSQRNSYIPPSCKKFINYILVYLVSNSCLRISCSLPSLLWMWILQ